MVFNKKRPMNDRHKYSPDGNRIGMTNVHGSGRSSQSETDYAQQQRPTTSHAQRNQSNSSNNNNHGNNKRSRPNNALDQHSNDEKFSFLSTESGSQSALALGTQGSRSGFPIIPGVAVQEVDDISGRSLVHVPPTAAAGGAGAGAASARASALRRHQNDPRQSGTAGGGARPVNRRQKRAAEKQNPLNLAKTLQRQNIPKTKAPSTSSVFAANNFSRNGTAASSSSNDRRTQTNRRDDVAQVKEYRDGAADMLKNVRETDSKSNTGSSSNMGPTGRIPRRKLEATAVAVATTAPAKTKQSTLTTVSTTNRSFQPRDNNSNASWGGNNRISRSQNNSRSNTANDVVDLVDDDDESSRPAASSNRAKASNTSKATVASLANNNRKPAPKSPSGLGTTRFGTIQIDNTSSPSEEDDGNDNIDTQPQQQQQYVKQPLSGSKEMDVVKSIACDTTSWTEFDYGDGSAQDSPVARSSLEDHPGKSVKQQQSPGIMGSVFKSVRSSASSVLDSLFKRSQSQSPAKPKATAKAASSGLMISKKNNGRDSRGKRKGSRIDVKASHSIFQSREDEEDAYIPEENTRKTRSSSGVDAGSFHGKSENPRQARPLLQNLRGRRTSERINKKDKRNAPVTITIDDDSESELEQSPQPRAQSRTKSECDAVRIAVGMKVFFSECKVALNNAGVLELSFKQTQRDTSRSKRAASKKDKGSEEHLTVTMDLPVDLKEIKFYIAGEASDTEEASAKPVDDETDQMSFLAMRVDASKSNGLKMYPNQYKPNEPDDSKRYILVEFRSDTELTELLETMRAIESLSPFIDTQAQLKADTAERFCQPFLADSEKEKKIRLRSLGSPASRKKQGFLSGKSEDEVLLVYPFDGDERLIEKAAEGLREASEGGPDDGDSSSELVVVDAMEIDAADLVVTDGGKPSIEERSDKDVAEPETKTRGRAHFLTVRAEDYVRLEPGEFLNDTLIDFWMQWISRKDDGSLVHFFSSHFYSALVEEGPRGVARWTQKKGIDIFEKRFIFVPINKSLHWSLCVVINAGAIIEHNKWAGNGFDGEEPNADTPFPCILFLDSLKAHQKAQVGNNIIKWLNAEWKRLRKSDDPALAPFTASKNSMEVFSPKIPYQDNSWDCGVFVCRYAYAVYLLRHFSFTYREVNAFEERHKSRWQKLITDGPEFSFAMPDIARLREEMKTLIEGLSRVYSPWKKERDRKEKEEKAASRLAVIQGRLADAAQNMSENDAHHSNTKMLPTAKKAANESTTSETAAPSTSKTDEDDNTKAVATDTTGDMDISSQIDDDECNSQEVMIV